MPLFPRIIPEAWKIRGIENLISKGSGDDRTLTEEFINDSSVTDLLKTDHPKYRNLSLQEIQDNIDGIRKAIEYAKKKLARARKREEEKDD